MAEAEMFLQQAGGGPILSAAAKKSQFVPMQVAAT
jgi:hypothetical protein